jgi:predicted nucleic acid-binding protein
LTDSRLLDTTFLSELRRPRPEPRVTRFISRQLLDSLFISDVTIAEIRFGIELVDEPERRSKLNDWLTNRVRPMFEARVLPITEDILVKWRLLVEEGRRVGHTFSQPDLFIAATALVHGLTVVSRDVSEYELAGVPVVSPWID